jgi:hypothetical protein
MRMLKNMLAEVSRNPSAITLRGSFLREIDLPVFKVIFVAATHQERS